MARSNSLLRKRLQDITYTEVESIDILPRILADLAAEISHSIKLAPNAPSLPLDIYNCFEFALGVAGRREVRLITEYLPSTFCNGSFVQHLVDSILISTTAPSSGDLVIYRDDRQITHAGLVSTDRIISKWGRGQLWIHGLLEVPAQYGEPTSYYEAPAANDVARKFVDFARCRERRELVDSVLKSKHTG